MDIQYNSCEDQQDDDFQIVASNMQQSNQQNFFDQIIQLLQEIVISQQFERNIQKFMKDNLHNLEQENAAIQLQTFQKFKYTFMTYLTNKLSSHIPNFNMAYFFQLLNSRKNQVDDQLLDTLESITDIHSFNEFMRACKTSHDQVETYKVLTIKSNKIPENKKVKGKDNIFGQGSTANPLFDAGKMLKKPLKQISKQQKMIQKTEDELLVPDLVLTVKGLRKE